MDEGNNGKKVDDHENIEQVLRERQRLDRVLDTRFKKKMTIMFTDVCGYTQYMNTHGDIRGRAWMQKHHDIVFPEIESRGGKILDIMGDGLMAAFDSTLEATKAAVAIQEGLAAYNRGNGSGDPIHVKIGINTGKILMDGDHIAGDVVNVASRIQNKAGPDQILISESVFSEVGGSEDILCRHHGAVRVKGKDQPLDLCRVVWQDETCTLDERPQVRSTADGTAPRVEQPVRVLHLEISREGNRLKVGADEQMAGDSSTVRYYETIPVPMETIGKRCRQMVETLNKANRRGRISRDVLVRLREIGQTFSDDLFTPKIKERLTVTRAEHLIVNMDDQLVQIPWELLHDGQRFMCQRFSMGRLVRTQQSAIGSHRPRLLASPPEDADSQRSAQRPGRCLPGGHSAA